MKIVIPFAICTLIFFATLTASLWLLMPHSQMVSDGKGGAYRYGQRTGETWYCRGALSCKVTTNYGDAAKQNDQSILQLLMPQ